ncbi:N-acetylmuramoyl-L-alanine amidase [Pseudokineococcus marinus]|uniref:LGFP repeat-containing protein n=1 Tax=Pseudokineococcus marinus TaxID=351215 RepID=A0A849BUG1_9ACTN|nr:N-acetylmuramoyl-L-alanine amidase [Pseudokineococcus marinus]NNH24587.1 hypothetical protein [Pseudokineococcus marinus]
MRLTRDLVTTGVVAALVAVPLGHAAAATPQSSPQPAPVAPEVEVVPLGEAGSAALASLEVTQGPASVVRAVAAGDAETVGVQFSAPPVAPVEVRVQDDAGWTSWTTLELEAGEDGAAPTGRWSTEPLWIGPGADDRQVEVRLGADDVDAAGLTLVDPGTSPADAAAAQAPDAALAAVGQPSIKTRAQWGADESIRTCTPSSATLKAATVHHAASANGYAQSQVPGIIRSFYAYHVKSNGWCDLGYNFLVDRFGQAWEGRYGSLSKTVVGAHAAGFNTGTVGVSMIGNYDTAAVPAAMVDTVSRVIAWRFSLAGIDPKGTARLVSGASGIKFAKGSTVTLPTIFAHRDVGYTTCPGKNGYAQMGPIRDRVAQLLVPSSAVVVPPAPLSAITAKWKAYGGASGELGAEQGPVKDIALGGQYQHFAGGSIFDGPRTAPAVVRGSILEKWASMGWEKSFLRFPTTDQTWITGGAFNHFERGSIYTSAATGAHVVRGPVFDKWATTGWENGYLGFPTTDVTPIPGGLFAHFQGGSVYYSKPVGTHVVKGKIRAAWASKGWEYGVLGFPTTDETPIRGGAFNHFQGGSVYFSPKTGAHDVRGAVRDRWASLGWERSRLGYPTADQRSTATGEVGTFQGGTITWTRSTGATTVRYR